MKKDIGSRLALAGLGAAISLIFVTLAYFIKNLSLSFYVLSSIGIMFPLTKKYYREAILSAIVVSVIGFFIANLGIIPFVTASGFYVVFSIFCHNKRFNKTVLIVIKVAYSIALFFVFYKLISVIAIDFGRLKFINSIPSEIIYVLFNLLFSFAFVCYDFLLIKGYTYLKGLLNK